MASQNTDSRGLRPGLHGQRLYGRKNRAMGYVKAILLKSAWSLLDDANQKLITDACYEKLDSILRPLAGELEANDKVDYPSMAKDVTKKVFSENIHLFQFEEEEDGSVLDELFDIFD
ncbi:hypothetical protein PGQ11_012708 [Apiospora arundinis]|uniref:Uncharacterized protein n=1 Tax=Apiospora arundinis TaxID=335852 RepID=A0ABR2I376_9PEZI